MPWRCSPVNRQGAELTAKNAKDAKKEERTALSLGVLAVVK
jgi:hypothetical protein